MARPEFVSRAAERADKSEVERQRYGYGAWGNDPRARSKWNYFTCIKCHRRMRYLHNADGGRPRHGCDRPDCAIEAARWQIRYAIERAHADERDDIAAFLRFLLDDDALASGDVTIYAPEPMSGPLSD